jgi:hypothetical protein
LLRSQEGERLLIKKIREATENRKKKPFGAMQAARSLWEATKREPLLAVFATSTGLLIGAIVLPYKAHGGTGGRVPGPYPPSPNEGVRTGGIIGNRPVRSTGSAPSTEGEPGPEPGSSKKRSDPGAGAQSAFAGGPSVILGLFHAGLVGYFVAREEEVVALQRNGGFLQGV